MHNPTYPLGIAVLHPASSVTGVRARVIGHKWSSYTKTWWYEVRHADGTTYSVPETGIVGTED